MEVIVFAYEYPNERNRAFKVLESCKTLEQLRIARNYFTALKNKWIGATSKNRTINMLVSIDEQQFLSNLRDKEASLLV